MNALLDNGPAGPAAAVYVHVPFCRDRCTYCAFPTVLDDPARHEALVEALRAEHSRVEAPVRPRTVYLGGGTPSRLAPAHLRRILDVVDPSRGAAEVTLEANPGDVSAANLAAWADLGIERVSVGVQTFRGDVLARLGRHHDGEGARRALGLIAEAWATTWTADLLVGWQGQSADDLCDDVDALLAFEPPHVSIYGLTVEPGTSLAALQRLGRTVTAPPESFPHLDDLWSRRLQAAGLERYEVSNFSRPGHRSLHNQAYWDNESYLGLGPGASSSLHPLRWTNVRDVLAYSERLAAGRSVRESSERVDPEDRLVESLAVGLRTRDGLACAELERRFGPGVWACLEIAAAPFLEQGWLRRVDGRLRLDPDQLVRADRLMSELAARLYAL